MPDSDEDTKTSRPPPNPKPKKKQAQSTADHQLKKSTMGSIGNLKQFDPAQDDFTIWVLSFQSFLTANDLDPEDDKKRCKGILLSSIGLQACALLTNMFAPEDPQSKSLDEIFEVLVKHYKPTPKALVERFKFTSRKQQQGENVNQFIAALRELSVYCKFDAFELNNRIRDQFIFGIRCEQTQRTLFSKEDDISLEKVLKTALAAESAIASTALIRNSPSSHGSEFAQGQVHKTSHFRPKQQWFRQKGKPQQQQQNSSHQHQRRDNYAKPACSSANSNGSNASSVCPRCGSSKHFTYKECPHPYEVECRNCGRKGHFAAVCRARKNADAKPSSNNSIQLASCVVSDTKTIMSAPVKNVKNNIELAVKINGVDTVMELDTGCETSILSEDFWKVLGSPSLQKSKQVFRTYTNALFRPIGELHTVIHHNGQQHCQTLPVSKGNSLFGRDLIKHFQIDWSVVQSQVHHVVDTTNPLNALLDEYADIFDAPTADTRIKNFQAKIILKDDAQPKFLKARPLPSAIRDKVDKELELMENSGVITKLEHSDWASPLVVVPKPNGRVRITGDFKNTVNSQLNITQYPIAQPDDIFATISGGQKFTKLDAANAFHQLELAPECKKFLVINTHRGLYQYNVLPQGISSSPAIFQEFTDTMLRGIAMTAPYQDDIIATGPNDSSHLSTLRTIFDRMRKYNFRLQKEKCEIFKDKVVFLGHEVSQRGIKTMSDKVSDILKLKVPTNVSELKSFLGLVNFYGKFINNASSLLSALYELTRKDTEWKWTSACQKAFDEVKQQLSSSPILAHFDPAVQLGISCDASSTGLGVVLFHKYEDGSEKPISYASKLLSDTERRYSQIEKEAYSIIFGIKKYYKYLCGRNFLLITDHKPLLAIFGEKSQLPPYVATRLNHWSLYLSQFNSSVHYRKSSEHGNADALSRLTTNPPTPAANEVDKIVNQLTNDNINILPVTASLIRKATNKDATLNKVRQLVLYGWPTSSPHQEDLKPYYNRRDELSITQGILVMGIRVIIPKSLQKRILAQLHECHFGIVKMKALSRQHVWWPKLDNDIENMCKSCNMCQENKANPPSAPLHPWQFPDKPFQRIHIDLAGPLEKRMWLILVDAHSKWPEVFSMNQNTTSSAVIHRLAETFARYGLPNQIVSDNGPQFTSSEFKKFCEDNHIIHSLSSSYHPRSNGEAERFVRTFKEAMRATDLPVDLRLQRFLLNYRSVPHSTTGVSPGELLQRRKLRTHLDMVHPQLDITVQKAQTAQENCYNKRVKTRTFSPAQSVWVKTFARGEGKWSPATIIRQLGPVTYLLKFGDKQIKRHADHIREAGDNQPTTST